MRKCLELIEELNDKIFKIPYFENIQVGFEYNTNCYTDIIKFGELILYCSENDSLSEWDEEKQDFVDITLKEFVIKEFNKLVINLNKINFE